MNGFRPQHQATYSMRAARREMCVKRRLVMLDKPAILYQSMSKVRKWKQRALLLMNKENQRKHIGLSDEIGEVIKFEMTSLSKYLYNQSRLSSEMSEINADCSAA